MKKMYVFTGYDKSNGKLNTLLRRDLVEVYLIIQHYSAKELEKRHKSVKDFNFDVMSQRSHEHALMIEDEKYIWSVFQVDK